jgi:hypothetical protein
MAERKTSDIVVQCPGCSARLTIDPKLGKVVAHEAPPKISTHAHDLDRAAMLLKEQAARREELFKQSAADLKTKSQVLDRIFESALEKSRDEPVTKPTRDIDLD